MYCRIVRSVTPGRFVGFRRASSMADILAPTAADLLKPKIISFGDHAFQVNDVVVRQSVILLPNNFLLWNARTFEDITIKSLSVFTSLYPTPEILFIGCGERLPRPLPDEITKHFRNKGIVVEASSTSNAAATFNMLSSEGRNVVAALLTLEPVKEHELGDEFR